MRLSPLKQTYSLEVYHSVVNSFAHNNISLQLQWLPGSHQFFFFIFNVIDIGHYIIPKNLTSFFIYRLCVYQLYTSLKMEDDIRL